MTDITTADDIKLMVDHFYAKVLSDDQISFIFTEVAAIDMKSHMPIMYDFWGTVLLGIGNYRRNPMTAHIELNKKTALLESHFNRWLDLFTATVDELFLGPKANEAKQRALNMAGLMKYKIAESNNSGFIQ